MMNCLNRVIQFILVSRKCAVSFDPVRASSRRFNTVVERFRAGLVWGK
jgi:hypothetical protein